jgi:pheromone shutdown protein TraB
MSAVEATTVGAMGRHGTPRAARQVPWQLVGWCAFAGLMASAALLLAGESWLTAVLVLGTGAVAVSIVVLLALVAPRAGAPSGRGGDHP